MITIHGEIHSSKNSRRVIRDGGGKVRVIKSKAAVADEKVMGVELLVQLSEWERMTAGQDYPYSVVFYFIRATKRKWDFANLVQGVADAMVKAGYIPDDDVSHFIPVYGGHEVDKNNPGVDIYLGSVLIH